jgi:HSP20 family molecular chaperone IbpA
MKSVPLISVLCLMTLSGLVLAQPPSAVQGREFGYSPTPNHFSMQKGLRFERYRDESGYHLRIETRGIDPDAIQVNVQHRSLVVQSQESHRVEQRSDRGSYQFSSSSSNMRRRFPLPPNADVEAMERSVEDGTLVITLPYTQYQRY